MGAATTALAIIAGVISFHYVNARYPELPADRHAEKDATKQTNPAPPKPSSACVDSDGSWKNWSFPNVPMLSPKCDTAN